MNVIIHAQLEQKSGMRGARKSGGSWFYHHKSYTARCSYKNSPCWWYHTVEIYATAVVLNYFSFRSFIAVHSSNFKILVSYARHLSYFQRKCSSLAPISSSLSSMSIQNFNLVILSSSNPVCLNLFKILRINLICGSLTSKILCQNLLHIFLAESPFT